MKFCLHLLSLKLFLVTLYSYSLHWPQRSCSKKKKKASLQYLDATLLKVWLQERFERNIMSEKQLNLGLFVNNEMICITPTTYGLILRCFSGTWQHVFVWKRAAWRFFANSPCFCSTEKEKKKKNQLCFKESKKTQFCWCHILQNSSVRCFWPCCKFCNRSLRLFFSVYPSHL